MLSFDEPAGVLRTRTLLRSDWGKLGWTLNIYSGPLRRGWGISYSSSRRGGAGSWECRPRGNRDMSANTSWEKTIQTPDDRRPDLGKKGYLDICSLKTRYTWGGVKFYFITWIDQWWWPFTDLLIFAHLYWGDRIFLGKYITFLKKFNFIPWLILVETF